jgi:hypothetical protein
MSKNVARGSPASATKFSQSRATVAVPSEHEPNIPLFRSGIRLSIEESGLVPLRRPESNSLDTDRLGVLEIIQAISGEENR